MGPIPPVSNSAIALPSVASATPAPSGAFSDLLGASIQKVEQDRASATEAARQFLSGDSEDLHKVALAVQRADLSSELFLQVRNKVISAYQEVMRMQM